MVVSCFEGFFQVTMCDLQLDLRFLEHLGFMWHVGKEEVDKMTTRRVHNSWLDYGQGLTEVYIHLKQCCSEESAC